MIWLHVVLLVFSGLLAISDALVAKRPSAKPLIDKLVPFQALIGLGLLVSGLVVWLRVGFAMPFRWISIAPLYGVTLVGMIASALLLGFFFGMPQLAKWIPGDSAAETAALRASQKLAPVKLVVGVIALAVAFLGLLYSLGVLKISLVAH